ISGRIDPNQPECGFHFRGKVRRRSVPVHVHVVDAGSIKEEVIVERRDVEPVRQQRRHDRIHFVLGEDEVTHHDVHATASLGQRQPSTEAEWRRRSNAIDDHVQIVAGDIDPEHVFLEVALLAQCGEDRLVIGGHGGLCEGGGRKNEKNQCEPVAHDNLLVPDPPASVLGRRSKMSGLMRLVLAAVLLAVLVQPAAAQTDTGEISGVVRDTQGGVLPGVTIVAEHLDSGTRIEHVTDGEGRYFFPSLRTGTYNLTADLTGFRRIIRSGLMLRLGQTVTIDFELEPGGLTEDVVVTGDPPLLRTNAEISDVIENGQVVQIPLNGRNFLTLAQLSDGVVLPPGGTRGDALQQAGPLPNVGGQRSGHNIYLLDGFKVTDELFNNLVINPSVDSIQEFKIQKSQYPAEFGGKASALINVATRTGTNTLHANVFDFGRDNRFDARNYFAPQDQPVPPLRQNQFGGTIGGPIKRNSTFFFGSYEGQRIRRSLTRTFSVPSAAARAGDFGSFRIPQSQIDPIASAFLEHVPLPNAPGESQNLTATGLQINNVDQVSVRIDQRVGVADQLFGRFSTFDANDHQPFGTGALQETLVPGFGRDVTTTARNIGISHTHVFSTKVMNELRAGWLRVVGGQVSVNRGTDFAGQVGLQ